MKSSFWQKVPVVRVFFPFVCGIGIAMFYSFDFKLTAYLFAASLLGFIGLFFFLYRYPYRWVHGVFMSITFFLFGILLHYANNDLNDPNHFSTQKNGAYLIVRVADPPLIKSKTIKLKAHVIGIVDSTLHQTYANGKLLLYIKKELHNKNYSYGDVLLIKATSLKEVPPPMNPEEFNYKRYLAFNNTHHQAYLNDDVVVPLDTNIGYAVYRYVYHIQSYFRATLDTYISSKSEIGVAQALLYGYDDDIDEETMQAYANTGTLHVLAVSGMHVGIIFMILGWLLKFMDKTPRLRFIKLSVILVFLWVYSLLCGLSPSILRATVMFSLIIVSNMLQRTTNVYNTLATSAFILLLFDCNMLANVGFQLSYMAVLGIVFLQPLIYDWYTARTRVGNEIWKITSVSIAAQITTSPIGILYFHQFPNCFLFSNLIIIPLTTLILYLGIVLLLFSKVHLIALALGKIMYYLIAFTNLTVKWVEMIPYSYINGIHISISQSILLYCLFGFLIAYFMNQQVVWFKLFIYSSILFLAIQSGYLYNNLSQSRLLVYHIPKQKAIHLIQGNSALLYIDSLLWNDKEKVKFHLQQHIWKSGVETQRIHYADSSWMQLRWNNKHITITGSKFGMLQKMDIDILIITYPLKLEWFEKFNPEQVIISSAIKHQYAEKIKSYFKQKKIRVYYTGDHGAFEIEG